MTKSTRLLAAAAMLAVSLPAQLKKCDIEKIEPKCGAELKFSDTIKNAEPSKNLPQRHRFKLEVRNAAKKSFGLLAVGREETNVIFPGTTCRLFVDFPFKLYPFATDKDGKYKLEFDLALVLKLTAILQVAVDDAGVVTLSNGIRAKCNDK